VASGESLLGKPRRAREARWHKLSKSTALENPAPLHLVYARPRAYSLEITSLKYENYCPWLRSVSLSLSRFLFLELPFLLRPDPSTKRRSEPVHQLRGATEGARMRAARFVPIFHSAERKYLARANHLAKSEPFERFSFLLSSRTLDGAGRVRARVGASVSSEPVHAILSVH